MFKGADIRERDEIVEEGSKKKKKNKRKKSDEREKETKCEEKA